MDTETHNRIDTQVHTRADGRAVIEQSNGAAVVLSADQILTVIEQLHACYDYCAAWKEPMNEPERTISETLP
jgi:hypothetical protein